MLNDFGFGHFDDLGSRSKILGLFIGLVTRLDVGDRSLHRWQIEGTLNKNIIEKFSALPEGSRGGYFPWFLAHDWIFTPPLQGVTKDPLKALKLSNASLLDEEDREISFKELQPEAKRHALIFYDILRKGYHPPPEIPTWFSLGFCTCRDEHSEGRLAHVYRKLIERCSFQEFWQAMDSSTMLDLLAKYDLNQITKTFRHFETVMTENCLSPSVWALKEFCYRDVPDPTRSVLVDYGFVNCDNPKDRQELKSVYRTFFDRYGDELELHAACCEGRLFQYLRETQPIAPRFQQLMRNLYPLKDE